MSEAQAAGEYKLLSEVVTPVNEKVTAAKDPGKPYVGLENIPSRGSHLLSWEMAESSISTNSVFAAGDVLFGKLRPNLRKCVAAPFDGYCSTDVLVLRAKESIAPEFAVRALQSEEVGAAAERSAIGTKMPRTAWEHLSKFAVFCPEITEQRKVAAILDSLDRAILKTEAIAEKLKQLKQGLLHDLLTRGVDANGELRPGREEAPGLYERSTLGWIPKVWTAKPLGDSIHLVSGQHIATELCNSAGKGVPYFTGPSDFSGATTVVTAYTTHPQVMCEKGDLLITVKGSGCGKVALAGARACISRQLMAIRVSEKTRPYWLAVLQSLQEQFNRMATGGNIPGIGRDQILGLVCLTPNNAEEMEAIGDQIQAMDTRLRIETTQLGKLRVQKNGLMDDLLTGRRRVAPLLEASTP